MRKKKPEDTLEEYLNEKTLPDDPELAALARAADRLERGLNVEAPDAYRERALFIQGVAARKPGFPWARLMVPVMAISVFIAFVAIGRDARPGDALYGFRKTLDTVGLAEDPARTARRVLDDAATEVVQAEALLEAESYADARKTALGALILLREAEELLDDGSGEAQEVGFERLEELRERASEVQEESVEEQAERAAERLENKIEDFGDDDNSGSGSRGSGGDDDNSGSGSDDSGGDDNSGSDSDDSGTDESSGSGSGSDDSSGSGSGSDDSSGSGSGSDDSSGSGSGSDDD